MVSGTREAFHALRSAGDAGDAGDAEIPRNLGALCALPTGVVVASWRRVFAGPRGGLWFGAHARAAREEMPALAQRLPDAVSATPDLDRLLDLT